MKYPRSLVRAAALAAILAAAAACQNPASLPNPSYTYATPPALSDGWATGSLEHAGIDRPRIEAMTSSIRAHSELNVHAVLIERGGRLVYEEYFSGKDERWGEPLGVVVFTRKASGRDLSARFHHQRAAHSAGRRQARRLAAIFGNRESFWSRPYVS